MRTWIAVLLALILISGCGDAPAPTPEPAALLTEAAGLVQDAHSFAVDITYEGPPAFVDSEGIINFKRAVGQYVAPDKVQARIRVLVAGIAGDIDVIAIGDDQYYRHSMLTGGSWIQAMFSPDFNAEALIQSDRGLIKAIGSLNNVSIAGRVDLDGIPAWHVTGTASSNDVAALTVGLIMGNDEVQIDLYVGLDDHRPIQMNIIQPEFKTEDNQPATWTIEVFDYDDPNHAVDRPQ